MRGERVVWMDGVRGTFILFVMIWHGTAVANWTGAPTPAWFESFNAALAPLRIPVLVFLSGMLLGRSFEKPAGPFVFGKFALLFWPCLIWSWLYLFVRGTYAPERLVSTIWLPETYLWYLHTLFLFYLAVLPIRRLRISFPAAALFGFVLSAAFDWHAYIDRALFLFPFFLMGHETIERGWHRTIPSWLVVLGAGATVAGGWLAISGHLVRYQPAYAWIPAGFLLVLIHFAPRIPAQLWPAPVVSIGANSIIYYVSHMAAQLAATHGLKLLGVTGFWPMFAIPFLVALAVAAGLQKLRTRHWLAALPFDLRAALPDRKTKPPAPA